MMDLIPINRYVISETKEFFFKERPSSGQYTSFAQQALSLDRYILFKSFREERPIN